MAFITYTVKVSVRQQSMKSIEANVEKPIDHLITSLSSCWAHLCHTSIDASNLRHIELMRRMAYDKTNILQLKSSRRGKRVNTNLIDIQLLHYIRHTDQR